MHRLKSILLTLFCAGIILGAGYLVIVESGKKVLEKERTLEEASYEGASSNIFYGKIEDGIEVFPWNYFPQEGEEKVLGAYPRFQETFAIWDNGSEESLKESQEWYLCRLVGWATETEPREVWDWCQRNQKSFMGNMVMVEDAPISWIYFYQEMLELGGKQYQVRVACSEWNIISFHCAECPEGQERDRDAWKQGTEKLVQVLESSEEELEKYFNYMVLLRNQDAATVVNLNGEQINTYLESLHWLENILSKSPSKTLSVPEEVSEVLEAYGYYYTNEAKDKEGDSSKQAVLEKDGEPGYSYQIVELEDKILLLMQGEQTLGVYYDPITQRFCGFNFFYDY